MILYLASDTGGAWDVDGVTSFKPLSEENGFVLNLKDDLDRTCQDTGKRKALVIASDPEAYDANDKHMEMYTRAFEEADIKLKGMELLDGRTTKLAKKLDDYCLLFIIGGYAPLQNRFFESIRLADEIINYDGIVMTMSAGSMNCAKTVYMIPEEPKDFSLSSQERFAPGLGLTSYNIIPHLQYIKTLEIDGKNLVDDIIREDSIGHDFIGLCDGSYFRIEDDDMNCMLYGEAYGISDGEIWKL